MLVEKQQSGSIKGFDFIAKMQVKLVSIVTRSKQTHEKEQIQVQYCNDIKNILYLIPDKELNLILFFFRVFILRVLQ
jgi:hypothetical protein